MSGFESPNYTQTPNDLFDNLMSQMREAELKVVMAVIRGTFGYHKDKFNLSIRKMAKMTGLSINGVQAGAEAAERRGLIERIGTTTKTTTWRAVTVSPSDTDCITQRDSSVSLGDTQLGLKKEKKEKEKIPSSPSGEIGRRNGHPFWKEEVLRMANAFSQARGVPMPFPTTARACKEANALWATPLLSILAQCEGDAERACRLIQLAVQHMEQDHLTCAFPKQIVTVAGSLGADLKKGTLQDMGLELTEEERVVQFMASLEPYRGGTL